MESNKEFYNKCVKNQTCKVTIVCLSAQMLINTAFDLLYDDEIVDTFNIKEGGKFTIDIPFGYHEIKIQSHNKTLRRINITGKRIIKIPNEKECAVVCKYNRFFGRYSILDAII